ncbi:serine/threonine-protein phosphatase 4 regulatory subunit 2-B-like [Mercenaria mercenaria]|uniref:serine/threonine-protein phosphatase 4 regulatory subunit 2-B-like n=1 Tax=Mercenaria mercenaria TaxID=6596 RepID=UPI00234F6C62|nr:serine/threonine-protein phosphatase 4 regulatory subunit 2-B-like [Mercenaria mercenaria]
MENQDKIQDVLSSFEKTPSRDIPPLLEDYLRTVAKTGKTVFPWQQLKLLFVQKLEQVMEQFNKDDPCDRQTPFPNVENTKFNEMRQRIIDALQKFNGAPFTVQRICELVTQPKKHYTQCDKFLRGIEKNVMVVSTVDPHGRKIVSDSHPLVNGLDMNGVNQQRSDLNDITDGQPFGPGPLVDWSGNNVATVWPEPTATDNKNNSSAANDEATTDEKNSEVKSDENNLENVDSGLPKAAPESENSTDQLVVKDFVVRDSATLSVSSNALSSETENKTEKAEVENTEQIENQDISKNEKSVILNQPSEMSLDSEVSGNSDSQSEVSKEEVGTGATTEKHTMDTTDATDDEPPEKKLKVDIQVPDSGEKEPKTQGPAVDESRVQDSTVDSSQVQGIATCEQTESSGNVSDAKSESCREEGDKIEKSTNAVQQQPEGNVPVSEDSQSKATTQEAAIEQNQSEDSLQKMAKPDCESSSENTSEHSVPSKTVLDTAETSTPSVGDAKINKEPQKQEGDGAVEQTEDSNSGAELMDTDTAPENKETVVEQKETTDESEPMEQE